MDLNEWVVVGVVDRSRGLRGEVMVSSLSGGPETFLNRNVFLRRDAEILREVHIDEAWPHLGRLVLKLSGVDSMDAADALRGVELCVRREDRLPLAEGEFYLSDLVGCELYDGDKLVGPVTSWQESPGAILLTVQHGSREALVPLVKAICHEVDVARHRINSNLPEGLLDL